ncbi:thiolase family protein [Nocardioides terrisoli]|uniref:thiolase family protein n=1 Tax=Nocardioides terrisoli TaxID=3388267 RepID=UPI00287BB8F5|nr:thiolase family protein [Nocardioides marmorisolisilvae]
MASRKDAPVIVAALRTPIGTAGKALASVDAAHLAASVLARVGADLPAPADVVLGNCTGPGGDVARVATLAAGLPDTVPAVTVDRQCGSGLAAVELGAALVRERDAVVLAGGVESASTAPWRFWPPADGAAPRRYQRAPFSPEPETDPDMGLAADLLAEEAGVSRARQDAYAARSHQRAWAAIESGRFGDEIVPVAGISRDQRPRPGMTPDRLGRLPAAFREGGSVTAGNSCGISDGAAVVAIAPASTQLPGLRVLATASAGVDPRRPGIGLVPAVTRALKYAALRLGDIDVIELNEAFAGQVLACCDALALDPERVCRQGGALALGHPWGASGAVLVVRLFTQMVREGSGRFGLAAIAVGGGQGVAMVVEACR